MRAMRDDHEGDPATGLFYGLWFSLLLWGLIWWALS